MPIDTKLIQKRIKSIALVLRSPSILSKGYPKNKLVIFNSHHVSNLNLFFSMEIKGYGKDMHQDCAFF